MIGGLVAVAAIVVAALLLSSGDDEGSPAVETGEGTSSTTAGAQETEAPGGADEEPALPSEVAAALEAALGDLGGYDVGEACRATDGFVHQTGGTPLEDPSLALAYTCTGVFVTEVPIAAPGPPVGPGTWLLVAGVTDAPLDPTSQIAMQPGLGLDRPGESNRPAGAEGEGINRVPVDFLAFGEQVDGWGTAEVYDPDDFSPLDHDVHAFTGAGSPVQAFVLPVDLVTPDSIAYLQTFGRQTPPGAGASEADPAASVRADIGPLGGCVGEPGPCALPPDRGRFVVQADVGAGPVDGTETGAGSFRFGEDRQVELAVKILDTCQVDDSYLVYAPGLTDPAFSVQVTDTASDVTQTISGNGDPATAVVEPVATCP